MKKSDRPDKGLFFYEPPEAKRGARLKRNQLQRFSAWQLSVKWSPEAKRGAVNFW
jgi:hypothetical protein